MIIAIDGPAASGKGTIASQLASHYGLPHLDTGLLYRAVGLATIDQLDAPGLEGAAIAAAQKLDPTGLDAEILGSADIARAASHIAAIPGVRQALHQFQRDFALRPGGAVLDGRDIGTQICPEADAKLFITASPEARAARRTAQLRGRGQDADVLEMLGQINARDANDRANVAGAFYQAEDAHLLDTTKMDIEAALRSAIAVVDAAMARKAE